MTGAELGVTLAGIALIAAVSLYFFAPRRAVTVSGPGSGTQQVRIVVRGGYQPARIEVHAGRPVRLIFRREETEGCSDTVLLPEWRIAQRLPAHQDTAVEFTPDRPGEYEFTCGMHMLRGQIVVR